MSKFESRQSKCCFSQSNTLERVAAGEALCLGGVMLKMALSFLLLSTIMLFVGQARATGSSMENWQGQAFTAIELQKRLDNLARRKKNRIMRIKRNRIKNNKKLQQAVLKQSVIKRQKQALAKERKRNKLKLRRSIQQAAARRRARTQSRKIQRSRLARIKSKQTTLSQIVTEPVKIQSCLKRAGYFKGVITGRLDDATLLAFLAFRDDKNLQSRPNDLYDPKSQEVLFSLCPDRNLNSLTQIVTNSLLGRKPVFVTSVREQQEPKEIEAVQASVRPSGSLSERKESEKANIKFVQKQIRPLKKTSGFPLIAGLSKEESADSDAFAIDVLAATDKSEDRLYTSGKKDRLPNLRVTHSSAGGKEATSSYAMRRTAAVRIGESKAIVVQKQAIVQKQARVKLAGLPAKVSPVFSRKLSISDLAMAGPSDRNTCSPQAHEPALAMSSVPLSSSRPLRVARNSDEVPLTTGAISPSYLRKAMRDNIRHSSRLLQRVKKEKPCLPQDLYDLLLKAHGEKKGLAVCKKDCLPAPAAFSSGQKELFAEQYKINWCGNGCLGLADPLPLKDVMQIEREARVHVCMTPQTKMGEVPSIGLDEQGINQKIRALYEKLPGGYGNDDNIAVLIGNKNYARKENKFGSAHINVAAMKALLLEQLGYRRENVIVVKDATRRDLVRLFGRKDNADGVLKRRLKANPNAQLMIYYSGHASSSGLGMSNYLLPIDAINGVESKTAYSLNVLYDNLRELDARTTQLFLDASFNADRGSLILAPNISERRVNIAPIVSVRGLAIYTASTGDQKPLVDPETGLGMFTRFLIGGLAGSADRRPIGNGDRVIDSVELYVHLAANVRLAARKTLGLKQNPSLSRTDNLFLSQLSRSPGR